MTISTPPLPPAAQPGGSPEEARRVEALRRYEVLDTDPEPAWDDLALLAARILRTPMALVALVDRDRQWYRAGVGVTLTETAGLDGFCAHAVRGTDLFVVPDAAADPRFAASPLVAGPPGIRFYAGAPLIAPDGVAIGTICVFDSSPRAPSAEDLAPLAALGRLVVGQLERRRAHLEQSQALAEARAAAEALRQSEEFKTRLIEGSCDCFKVLDLEGRLLSMNAGGMAALEICDLGPFVGSSWIDFWQGEDRAAAQHAVDTARAGGVGRFTGFFATTQTRDPRWWDVIVSPIRGADGKPERLLSLSRDVTRVKRTEDALEREIAVHNRLTRLFHVVSEGTAAAGEAFFRALVRHIAEGLGIRYAFITECVGGDRSRVRLLAFWRGTDWGATKEYDVAGTPCRRVMGGETCRIADDVQQNFPGDQDLAALNARSYWGFPLVDSAGAVIGHLALLDEKPLGEDLWMEPALRIFAARAGAELERLHAEALRRSALEELERARNRLHAENIYLRAEVERHGGFEEIIGDSPAIRRTLVQVEQVGPTDTTVLITGETGSGKELIARAIHAHSPRRDRPLVAINCGAISPGLVESELFGHEKGAFTGALTRRAGRFELADGGTLFLDEIGDLSLDLQVKLLRVLQEGEFNRVGGQQAVKVDVRVVAATHRDLPALVRAGTFRQDLYYRLNVFPIRTPPLRERLEDLPLLVEYFVAKYAARLGKRIEILPSGVLDALRRHPWPGNVRELANVIERSVIVSQEPELTLAEWLTGTHKPADETGELPTGRTLEEMERDYIVRTLERTRWKVSGPGGAAEALNLKPTTLEARMKKLGIVRPR
jgi:transcriptional regulator with GAF, ATPase, and Fis domain/PAS domain-containing protein